MLFSLPVFFVETLLHLYSIHELKLGVAQNTFQLLQSSPNFTELDKQILHTTRDSAQKLISIVNTLSNLQDTSTSTAGVADDILLIAHEVLSLHNDSTASSPTVIPLVKRLRRDSHLAHWVCTIFT